MTVKDPLSPVSLALTAKKATLQVGRDIDMKQWTRLRPVYAKTRFSYASSDKSVARVGKDGIVRAMKPGKATVTVSTKNGLKARLKLTVKANRTPALHAKPTARSARKLGVAWTLWPGSLEMKGDGSIACHLWLVNGSGARLTALKDLELSVWQLGDSGETLIARDSFGMVEAACGRNKWKRVSITFPASSIQCTVADFTKLTKKKLSFRLNGIPTAKVSYGYSPYMPTAIGIEGGIDGDNPVRYRALLVGETKFYWGDKPGNPDDWERIPSFYRDIEIMKATLERVKGPEGGRYQITCRKNTDLAELTGLIQTTFADADSNDVSLFFFSGHGNSSDEASDAQSGALVMASKEERHCEEMPMSTLRDLLLKVPGKVIVMLSSCGSGAAVYTKNGVDPAQAARRFDEEAVNAFRSADPGLASNTGELRVMNKFYVLTTAAYREEAWGDSQGSFFAVALEKGVGRSGDMPADRLYAGNRNGVVDLHELYRYLSSTLDYEGNTSVDGKTFYQHVQVYPGDTRYALFR